VYGKSRGAALMLTEFHDKEVVIFFLDGQSVAKGKIIEIDERYVKYQDPSFLHIIPISSIRNVQLQTGERQTAKFAGFSNR
jgi:hypothetical protein